jgi:large subunit ribosomal protein L5
LPAKSWDGHGNYTFGLNDQTVFTEIEYDKVDVQRGMDITVVTTATTDEAGKALLEAFGFPFQKGADDSSLALPKRSSRGQVRRGGRSAKR